MSFITILLIGFAASVSTCIATVGGLLFSLSANYTDKVHKIGQQLSFHLGRLLSFFILGGLVGWLGKIITPSIGFTVTLNVIVGLVMIFLGLKLLGFSLFKKFLPSLPNSISTRIGNFAKKQYFFTPAILGVLTFFLPCGFTQSMQIYTLSTGGFVAGGLTMLFFALGTLPVLFLLGLGASNLSQHKYSDYIIKFAGVVIIIFSLITISNSFGWSFSNFGKNEVNNNVMDQKANIENGKQIIYINVSRGYIPESKIAQSGIPTVLRFKTENVFDCSSSVVVPSLKLRTFLSPSGLTDLDIGTSTPGSLKIVCGMNMYSTKIYFK